MITRPFARSSEKGARTAAWLAASPDVTDVTGRYFVDCRTKEPSKAALDTQASRQLWEVSEELTGIA